jgi:hypothetical protein
MKDEYIITYEILSGDELWLPGVLVRVGTMKQAQEFCDQRMERGKARNMRIHVMRCVETIVYDEAKD